MKDRNKENRRHHVLKKLNIDIRMVSIAQGLQEKKSAEKRTEAGIIINSRKTIANAASNHAN